MGLGDILAGYGCGAVPARKAAYIGILYAAISPPKARASYRLSGYKRSALAVCLLIYAHRIFTATLATSATQVQKWPLACI